MRTKLWWALGLAALVALLVNTAGASVVSRWTFDEGAGTTVADSLGRHPGEFRNSPSWVPGVVGSAVRVHNQGTNEALSNYVSFGNGVVKGPDFSVGVWMKMDKFEHIQLLGQSQGNNSTAPGWFIFPRQQGLMWFVVNGPLGGWNGGHLQSELGTVGQWYKEKEWVHLAFTFKDATKELTGYFNGKFGHSRIIDSSRSVINCPAEMKIAQVANRSANWDAEVDDLVIYDQALTADEIPLLMEGKIVAIPQASQPKPEDGSLYEDTYALLSWQSGGKAASHNVYVGTDAAAVERATEPTVAGLTEPTLTIGLPLPGDPFPNGLEYGKTYYWRVDEINGSNPDSPWTGPVWSFTVPSQEAYNPYPASGMIDVPLGQTLTWAPGFGVQTHTVYLGTDPNVVANATTGGKVVGQASYTPAQALTPGTTYYWRVDETNVSGVAKGEVWSLTAVPNVPVTDASLIGWWKLDGPDAALMRDSSGHGLHAEIITPGGSVAWIPGAVDGAIRLDGLSDIRTVLDVNSVSDVNSNTVTFTAWIRPDIPVARVWGILQETGPRAGLQLGSVGGGTGLRINWPSAGYTSTGLVVAPAQWAFVAAVVSPQQATLYLNGKDITEVSTAAYPPVKFNRQMEIGMDGSGYGTRFIGALDDLRFYSRSLTPTEIEQVMKLGTPPQETDAMTIDSFDGYRVWGYQTDATDIWDAWVDGYDDPANGAIAGNQVDQEPQEPYMEMSNVAGGTGLALPMSYDNTVATKSEVTRTFSPAQDLTRENATSLIIWVRGPVGTVDPADDVYVVLTDGVATDTIQIATAEAVLALPQGTPVAWKKVTIALSSLTIDRTKLTSMTIGVGNRTTPVNGGTGTVYIDNIALE